MVTRIGAGLWNNSVLGPNPRLRLLGIAVMIGGLLATTSLPVEATSTPALSVTAIGPGTAVGTTTVTATPASADALEIDATATAPPAVPVGAVPPTGATAYTSGSNLSGVAVGNVVTLYEVNGSGTVVAMNQWTLSASDVNGSTPPPIADAEIQPVTNTGQTAITASQASGDSFEVAVTASTPSPVRVGSTPPAAATAYTNDSTISGVAAGNVATLYEVDGRGVIVAMTQWTLTTSESSIPGIGIAPGTSSGTTTITASVPQAPGPLRLYYYLGSSPPSAVPGGNIPPAAIFYSYPPNGGNLGTAVGQLLTVYQADDYGRVFAVSQWTLTASDVNGSTPPAIAAAAIAPGTAASTTAITASPASGDSLKAAVTSSAPAATSVGATPPPAATAYRSGSNLSASAGQIVTLYEVDGRGVIVGMNQWTLSAQDLALPLIPSATIAPGTKIGTTAITASLTSGDALKVEVSVNAPSPVALGATLPTGTATYAMGSNLTAVVPGDVVTLYEVNASSAVEAMRQWTLTAADIAAAPPIPVWTPPILSPDPVTIGSTHSTVIGNRGYNPPIAIQRGSFHGYVEERAAIGAGATFNGEGTDSAYLSAILDGSGVGVGDNHVTAVQQGQFAALYQKLGIIPTWTDTTVTMPHAVAALVKASASSLAIENYLVQLVFVGSGAGSSRSRIPGAIRNVAAAIRMPEGTAYAWDSTSIGGLLGLSRDRIRNRTCRGVSVADRCLNPSFPRRTLGPPFGRPGNARQI